MKFFLQVVLSQEMTFRNVLYKHMSHRRQQSLQSVCSLAETTVSIFDNAELRRLYLHAMPHIIQKNGRRIIIAIRFEKRNEITVWGETPIK
jgi:hypothetical protein